MAKIHKRRDIRTKLAQKRTVAQPVTQPPAKSRDYYWNILRNLLPPYGRREHSGE
jgi:hypothetical protein